MEKIQWNEEFRTAIKCVDDFHLTFIELINELEEEIVAKSSLKDIKSVLSDIYDLSKVGLQEEESLMNKSAFPEFEMHLESHQKFLSELEFFITERIKTPEDEAYYECYNFLYNWFFKHALVDKADFYRYFEEVNKTTRRVA